MYFALALALLFCPDTMPKKRGRGKILGQNTWENESEGKKEILP